MGHEAVWTSLQEPRPAKLWGVLVISNVGRRPIFVSHASLHVPGKTKYFLLMESIEGVRLSESDAPKQYMIDQQALSKEWAAKWRTLRGCVVDHTGKHWHSARMTERPSWAKSKSDGEGAMITPSDIKPEDRKHFLLKEIENIQKVFDKIDGWIVQTRVGVLVGAVALAAFRLTSKPPASLLNLRGDPQL